MIVDWCDDIKDRSTIERCQMKCLDALQYLFEKNRAPSEISRLWGGISHYLTESYGLYPGYVYILFQQQNCECIKFWLQTKNYALSKTILECLN